MLRIKSLRTEQGFSQRVLAMKIGSSQKAVDYWEKGLSEPTAGFIIKLADCFGCSADYLLGREDDCGNVNIESDLTESEKKVLTLYRALSEPCRSELIHYAEYLKQK